jgi:hypothetical protein
MTDLTVANTLIRKNESGLYCLNDLHKASGGESKNKPQYFMMNKRTKDLIAVCSDDGIPSSVVIKGGENQGTYVCKELVYAYAMWISAEFYHHVIKTYDAVVTGQLKMSEADERMLKLTRINPNTLKAITGSRNNNEVGKSYEALESAGIMESVIEWKSFKRWRFTADGLNYCNGYHQGIPRFKDESHDKVMLMIEQVKQDNPQLSIF